MQKPSGWEQVRWQCFGVRLAVEFGETWAMGQPIWLKPPIRLCLKGSTHDRFKGEKSRLTLIIQWNGGTPFSDQPLCSLDGSGDWNLFELDSWDCCVWSPRREPHALELRFFQASCWFVRDAASKNNENLAIVSILAGFQSMQNPLVSTKDQSKWSRSPQYLNWSYSHYYITIVSPMISPLCIMHDFWIVEY